MSTATPRIVPAWHDIQVGSVHDNNGCAGSVTRRSANSTSGRSAGGTAPDSSSIVSWTVRSDTPPPGRTVRPVNTIIVGTACGDAASRSNTTAHALGWKTRPSASRSGHESTRNFTVVVTV